jgi:hypothetical protein
MDAQYFFGGRKTVGYARCPRRGHVRLNRLLGDSITTLRF